MDLEVGSNLSNQEQGAGNHRTNRIMDVGSVTIAGTMVHRGEEEGGIIEVGDGDTGKTRN
jgi:hypothetical protein